MPLKKFVDNIIAFLDQIILLIIALGITVFLYGLVVYIASSGNKEKRKESIRYITAGIIGLFIMVAFWAVTNIFSGTFFGTNVAIPQIK